MQKFFKKGNGTMIVGITMMLLCLSIYAYFANLFFLRENQYDAQLAADSIADGVAVSMTSGSYTYKDAAKTGVKMMKLISKHTNSNITELIIDEKRLTKKKEVAVDVQTKSNLAIYEKGHSSQLKATASAVTKFSGLGLLGADSAIQWGYDSRKYAHYSNANRTGIGSHGYITSTDCSGFCWLVYRKMGCTAPLWYTGDMGKYFYHISPSQAVRGDVLFITAAEKGSAMGHAKIYLGNGETLEMTGHVNGIVKKTVDIHNLGGYHFGRIKPQYMSQ